MGLADYLRDRAAIVGTLLAGDGLALLALRAHGADLASLALAACLLLGALAVALVVDWLRRRPLWAELDALVDSGEDPLLAPELARCPHQPEAALLLDVVSRLAKSMRDRLGQERADRRDYREYVETWVHEVKTPIAAARLVARNNPSPATDRIDAELSSIEGYVEQALYYSRSTSLDRDFQVRSVVLADVARDALRRQARTLIDAGVTPCLEGLDATVRADPKWLAFVLGQLLVNAAKYRRDDGEPGHVVLRASRAETGLDAWETVLEVCDDGIGMPACDVGRAFDRGFTGENGRRFARSTGMGLYLVRELCRRMGLGVGLDSRQGEGTRVTLRFPDSVSA